MNDTMKCEMCKYIKPQDIKEAPQYVDCCIHAAAGAPDAPNLVSPNLASRLPGILSEFAPPVLFSASQFQPLDFSPFHCPHLTMQGFSDQKKLMPHSKCIVV